MLFLNDEPEQDQGNFAWGWIAVLENVFYLIGRDPLKKGNTDQGFLPSYFSNLEVNTTGEFRQIIFQCS